jgi:hypothetical protein
MLAPKLATILVAATVATLSLLSSPAYADPVVPDLPPIDDGGTIYMTWSAVEEVSAYLFYCRWVEVETVGGTYLCVDDPLS